MFIRKELVIYIFNHKLNHKEYEDGFEKLINEIEKNMDFYFYIEYINIDIKYKTIDFKTSDGHAINVVYNDDGKVIEAIFYIGDEEKVLQI